MTVYDQNFNDYCYASTWEGGGGGGGGIEICSSAVQLISYVEMKYKSL